MRLACVTGSSAFGYDGQKCSATSRLYLQKGIKDRFLEELVRETSALKIGDPRRREVFMGPVINRRAVENFKQYVDMTVAEVFEKEFWRVWNIAG